jgi:hypothetical protein
MFFEVTTKLNSFLLMFVIFIIVFTLINIILGVVDLENVSGVSDYPGLNIFVIMLFTTFRTSIGDLQISDYSKLADNNTDDEHLVNVFSTTPKNIFISLVWIFWLMDIYLILIVMLNLLIA